MRSRQVSFQALIVLLAMLAPLSLLRGDLSRLATSCASGPSPHVSQQHSPSSVGLLGAFEENVGQFAERARFLLRTDDQIGITTELGEVLALRPETPADVAVEGVQSNQATIPVFDLDPPMRDEAQGGTEPMSAVDDPGALRFGTFLGSAVDDYGTAIAVDGSGRVYVAGLTNSPSFPTTAGAYDRTHNGGLDVFVARLNATGTALEYATFIGGSGDDYANGIAVDGSGSIYVVGTTSSTNFPVTSGSYDMTHNGAQDVFVLRLGPGGAYLQFSTYLGGSGQDEGETLAVDAAGQVYVAGYTRSANFPVTAGAYDTTHNGGSDAFVARLNAAGAALGYATFAGGSNDDYAYEMAIDANARAYVAGTTTSSNFPTTADVFDVTHNGGEDAFAFRLNAMGSALSYSTFLGGSGVDRGVGIATDSQGRSTITGYTASANFPVTATSFDSSYNGGGDVFITRLDASGSGAEYSGFLGGGGEERSFAVVVDTGGRASVVGSTRSSNFPVTSNAFDSSFNGGVTDAFMARVGANGSLLEYGTFVGGSGNDEAYAVALDPTGDLLATGFTSSVGFPTTASAYDNSHNGRDDSFVARLAPATSAVTPTPTRTPTPSWTPTPTPTWTPTPTPTGGTGRSRFLPLLVRAVVPTPTPTATPVPGDPFEPNNSFSQAWGLLASSQVYRALFYSPDDREDFYWFDMPVAHAIQVDLWDIPAGHDYHLYLYNASYHQVGYSGNPGNQPEVIFTSVLPAGRYYVRVQQVNGFSATERYALRAIFR